MSKSSKIHIEYLIREIEVAFSNSQYPGDEQLVFDNSGYDLECVEIAEYFRGKHWKIIPLEKLRYHADSLFFFTSQAYAFYLPAYLLVSIRFYFEADMVPHNVIYTLTPPKEEGDKKKRFLNRMSGFSSSQKSAIRSFVKFFLAEHPGSFSLGDTNIEIKKFWSI